MVNFHVFRFRAQAFFPLHPKITKDEVAFWLRAGRTSEAWQPQPWEGYPSKIGESWNYMVAVPSLTFFSNFFTRDGDYGMVNSPYPHYIAVLSGSFALLLLVVDPSSP